MIRFTLKVLALTLCPFLTACEKSPTPVQIKIVDDLIQSQIDIPYVEQNWESARERLAKDGETPEQAADRNKKLYSDIHDFLIELQQKPYSEKKVWAIRHMELELEGLERGITFLRSRDEDTNAIVARYDALSRMLAKLK